MPEAAIPSSKFQVSIPEAVQPAQYWEGGHAFLFIPKGKGVFSTQVPKRGTLKGMAKGVSTVGHRNRSDRF